MADLSVEKLLSRLYSIQRGIISPKNAMTQTMSRIYSKNRGVTKKYGGKINKKKK